MAKDINTCFWGEPLFGFYRDTDRWVLRRHAEMLADAGVDVIFFDCTNGSFTWRESYTALCEVFAEARRDGVQTPQIAFMLAFGPTEGSRDAIKQIYLDLYKPAVYDDLFFRWQGKPLIMAYPEMLGDVEGDPEATALHREIREYFTFRPGQPSTTEGPNVPTTGMARDISPARLRPDAIGPFRAGDRGCGSELDCGTRSQRHEYTRGLRPQLHRRSRARHLARRRPLGIQLPRAVGSCHRARPLHDIHNGMERVGHGTPPRMERPRERLSRPVRPRTQPRHRTHARRPRRQLLLSDGSQHTAIQGYARRRHNGIGTRAHRHRPGASTTGPV